MALSKRGRWFVWFGVFVAPGFVGLAAVLLAVFHGASSRRLGPVAGFLALWAVSATYVTVVQIAERRRRFRLRREPIPRDIRLGPPLWILPNGVALMLGLFAIPGTVAAAFGFVQVGVGMQLVGAMIASTSLVTFGLPRTLTIEEAGIRFHLRASQFFIPWTSIRETRTIGPEHSQSVQLKLDDVEGIVASVTPDTPRGREGVRRSLSGADAFLQMWSGGLDGETLARAIREGKGERRERAN